MPTSREYRAAPHITTLGDGFYDVVRPARFPRRVLRFRNQRWAARVGLGDLDADEWESFFARFEPLPENLATPLALRYHGHQFDVYNPELGDGRGFLFAQVASDDGRLLDLATKGSGTTPWSRGGDGRLTLKGGVREVLATEMLEALGVPTSKSFSLFETGEALVRGDEPSPTRSAVLVRLGHSHVRFGTFQRLAYLGDTARLDALLSYVIARYFPALSGTRDRVSAFLAEVTRSSAVLTARWMVAGFVHGVLNSDNMVVTGESFDYGPYRFLPTYDPGFVAAYFDHQGLYAYGRQPVAVKRNLVRLAGALRPLASSGDVSVPLEAFDEVLHAGTTRGVVARLGLVPRGVGDAELAAAVRELLEESGVGYDRFFFDFHGGRGREARALAGPAGHVYRGPRWEALRARLSDYEPASTVRAPYFDGDGPCSLLIDEVETIWKAIAEDDDWSAFYEKVERIREMASAVAL